MSRPEGAGESPGGRRTPRLVLRGARWPGDVALGDGRILAVGRVEPEEGDTELRCLASQLWPE